MHARSLFTIDQNVYSIVQELNDTGYYREEQTINIYYNSGLVRKVGKSKGVFECRTEARGILFQYGTLMEQSNTKRYENIKGFCRKYSEQEIPAIKPKAFTREINGVTSHLKKMLPSYQ